MNKIIIILLTFVFLISDTANSNKNGPNLNQKQLNHQLIIAILKNDLPAVKRIVQQGADVNHGIEKAIHVVIEGGSKKQPLSVIQLESFQIVRKNSGNNRDIEYKLVYQKSNQVEVKTIKKYFQRRSTPICFAALVGNITLIQFLIDEGAILYSPIKTRKIIEPLEYTINNEIYAFFMNKGIYLRSDINQMLTDALDSGDVDRVKIWMEKGVDIQSLSLHLSKVDIQSFLFDDENKLDKYLDKGLIYMSTFNLLFHSGFRLDYEIAKLLVQYGSDVNDKYEAAIYFDHKRKEWIFDERGGNVDTCQSYLHRLMDSRGGSKMAKLLIENGIDVNLIDGYGETPLFYAIRSGNYEDIKLLLGNGADLNLKGLNGLTPLDIAIDYYDGLDDSLLDDSSDEKKIIKLIKQYQK